jgi:hypothetical protein
MSKMFGDNFVSGKYISMYPKSRIITEEWQDRVVAIETENGYWRPDCCGYAYRDGPVGAYTFGDAVLQTRGLGEEKKVKIHCYNTIVKERRDF